MPQDTGKYDYPYLPSDYDPKIREHVHRRRVVATPSIVAEKIAFLEERRIAAEMHCSGPVTEDGRPPQCIKPRFFSCDMAQIPKANVTPGSLPGTYFFEPKWGL